MRKKILVTVLSALSLSAAYSASTAPDQQASLKATFTSMPLAFTVNQGQWPDSILYRASAGGTAMWFTPSGVYYQFIRRISRETADSTDFRDSMIHRRLRHEPDSIEQLVIKASFLGAKPSPEATGLEKLSYKCNYFLGNEPAKWRTDVPNYESIRYSEVYPGIDLEYYGNGKQMEYDFIVSPGADYRQVQIRYEGAESLSVGENGQLIIKTGWGEIIEQPPEVHQIIEGHKENFDCDYVIASDNTFSFEVDSRYNPAHELVIDPVLVYSTYLGGGSLDFATGIAVDAAGGAYVVGITSSASFPTLNPYQPTLQGNSDVFVTKLSADGNSLVYSTYLGGSNSEFAYGIAVDADGGAYVFGETVSTDFPTLNPYQPTMQGSGDAFVTKLSAAGNSLVYSTYLGGSDGELSEGIVVDAAGAAYVIGSTTSTDFPTLNPYQTTKQGYYDAFVTKLSASGNSLVYSTYLGGSIQDYGSGIAVDAAGAAYVTGYTASTNFPTFNPYQAAMQGSGGDAFVTKLSATGNNLVYSTYLGGSGDDWGYGIAVDAFGAAYVFGETVSTNFPTLNPYQATYQGGGGVWSADIFVTKLSAAGNSLVYSTYLGGSADDFSYGNLSIAVDAAGAAYVMGGTSSTDFPTLNPYQATNQGDYDVFVTKFSAAGNSLVYSTYLGGSGSDFANGIAVDAAGAAYVIGETESTDFPMLNPYQTTNQGDYDAFVIKLDLFTCGDVNNDGTCCNILDLTYLVDYIFRSGPPAPIPESADLDGDSSSADILDLTVLVDYIFRSGPAPMCGL